MSSLLPEFDVGISHRPLDVIGSPRCGQCGLKDKCITYMMKPFGDNERKIMVIGEAPGASEDQKGVPFIGKAGDCLRRSLVKFDVDLDRDCITLNSLSCRPPSNATPTDKQVKACRPLVKKAIEQHQPNVILLLGASAVQSVIAMAWGKEGSKKDGGVGGINRWCGFVIPCQRPNAWIVPTYHPSHIERCKQEARGKCMEEFFFERHLELAISLASSKPWERLPRYEDRVRTVMHELEAVVAVSNFIDNAKPIVFDYETDRLKPDHPDATIICCSVSDGMESVAFPWTTRTREAMGELLRSDIPKIGYNDKFETRWTLREFGHGVTNWRQDGMLDAHVLDNRPDTKSLEFQAFLHLGQPSHKAAMEPHLKAETSNSENGLRKLIKEPGGWKRLLVYNALDSMLEWHVAMRQREELSE